MKKIGLVTYFKSYNYGVWLQAYATEKFLENNMFDVEIINYANKYEEEKLKYSYKEGDKLYGYITSFIKSLLFGKVKYYRKGFKNNLDKYYHLSSVKYNDLNDLKEVTYDILAVGSDQVWNPKITSGLDPVFLLNFGKAKKKISIASSLGSKVLTSDECAVLTKSLSEFNSISVREKFAKEYLQKFVEKEIKVLADPTFLLNKEEWKNFGKQSSYFDNEEKYILTYFVSKDKYNEKNVELVKAYSKKMNLPVWAIQFSSFFSKGVDKKILGASVADFIALVNNAALVITDSFHGTALSINLQRNFVSCINTENPIRTQNLLKKMGLIERINMSIDNYTEIDYSRKYEVVEEYRNDSQNWLLRELNK